MVTMPTPLTNRASLTRATLDQLAHEVGGHATLHDVLEWGFTHKPARRVEEIVTQDEYTHDVLVPLDAPLYLAYDVS
jgi:hypothetical protein